MFNAYVVLELFNFFEKRSIRKRALGTQQEMQGVGPYRGVNNSKKTVPDFSDILITDMIFF